eukprot:10232627-Alexandrium_andersonii.AAC.1
MERGRARNFELNGLRRHAAAAQAACSITWRRRHVCAHVNAADADSRLAERGVLVPGGTVGGRQLLRPMASQGKDALGHVEWMRARPGVEHPGALAARWGHRT